MLARGVIDMTTHRLVLIGLALAAALLAPEAGQSQQGQSSTKVGMLSCRLNPTIGLIVGSRQTMDCQFTPDGFAAERYSGTMTTIGLDIGFQAGGVMGWAVFAPAAGPLRGALAGTYVGATGEIGVGVGAGANVLVGGSNRSIALQPVSLSGSVGVNLALGVSGLELRQAP
jgi:hypothetical protein